VVVTIFVVVTHLVLLETRRIDGCLDTDLFLGRVLGVSWELELRRVDGSLDSSLFTVGWLEARSVFTLGHVNLSLVASTAVFRKLDADVGIVVSSVVWELNVDVCGGVLVVGSALFTDVDVFTAARTVVAILFAVDVNFFLTELVSARRESG
jgi:hypothetical protein